MTGGGTVYDTREIWCFGSGAVRLCQNAAVNAETFPTTRVSRKNAQSLRSIIKIYKLPY